jgi:hypothetical protein
MNICIFNANSEEFSDTKIALDNIDYRNKIAFTWGLTCGITDPINIIEKKHA